MKDPKDYLISVRIPLYYGEKVEKLIKSGKFRNKSDVVKAALEHFFTKMEDELLAITIDEFIQKIKKDQKLKERILKEIN